MYNICVHQPSYNFFSLFPSVNGQFTYFKVIYFKIQTLQVYMKRDTLCRCVCNFKILQWYICLMQCLILSSELAAIDPSRCRH